MEVQFYYNQSDARQINKVLVAGGTFEGQARDEVNVINPVIIFDTPDILPYNYAYIPEFQRYYTIADKNAYREGLFEVTFDVDVLMSFRQDIFNMSAVVDKQTMPINGDEYIDDSSLVADNVQFVQVFDYPNGFNENPEYILITAG